MDRAMRNQFTFYKSFDDVIEDMNDKQIAEYVKTMLDVQFLRIKIDDVKFEDKVLNMVWKSQRHSIQTSIKGYLDSQKRESVKNPYLGIYDNSCNPSEGVAQQEKDKEEVQEKGKEQDKEEEQIKNIQIVIEDENTSLAKRTIDYLNKATNKSFKYGKGNLKEILAQIKKGATEKDFAHVINVKCNEWLNDQKMKKHLNPITLFRECNFDKYLNQDIELSESQQIDAYLKAKNEGIL
jgi:uncharacterized phage protein (TIGR02220 family)